MNEAMQLSLQRISRWGNIVGWTLIIVGGLHALSGFTLFIVGAIPGVLMVFLGLYLIRSAQQARKLKDEHDETALPRLFENFANHIRVNTILVVISLLYFGITFIIAFFSVPLGFF